MFLGKINGQIRNGFGFDMQMLFSQYFILNIRRIRILLVFSLIILTIEIDSEVITFPTVLDYKLIM